MENIVAYEVDKGSKYFVGIYNGIKRGKFCLKDGCMIKRNDLPKGKKLEDGLKEVYINSQKENKEFSVNRIMSPEPYKFSI